MTVEISGLNLEKLLREAQGAGIRLTDVRRVGARCMSVRIAPQERARLAALCERFGWEMDEVSADLPLRAARFLRARRMLIAGAAVCLALIALSEQMVLGVSIDGAQEYRAQVSTYLARSGVRRGAMKRRISFDALREGLLLHLPGLSHVSLRFAGSMLEVECHLAREGENIRKEGEGADLVAQRDGIVTKIVVSGGTPQVAVGDAVHAGQVLIRGEERTSQGGMIAVAAQGQVTARVWAQGSARASLYRETAQETGRTRTRVTLYTPWYSRVVRPAQPFESQQTTVTTQKVVDLFIPLWRKIETFKEITFLREPREQADAASQAQGAAELLAKKQLSADVLILDKWVEYSMIDNEFVCADVVIEYEQDIAVRQP